MGTISMHYNIKPKPFNVFKDDLGLEVLDYNITKIDGDIIDGNQLDSYVIYSACKYKNDVLAFIGLIDYDLINKQVFCKIMDETVEPFYYDMKKSVFNKLTDIKEYPNAIKWRKEVSKNFK
jgi:hypothetical protein